VPLSTMKPELALKLPWQSTAVPDHVLGSYGIKFFKPFLPLSFNITKAKYFSWVSPKGSRLGIDREDHLYYVHNRWWRRRLYKIPRVPLGGGFEEKKDQQGGRLAIQDPQWFPSGKYVILDHYFLGILILEPQSGRIGILVNDKGHTFGWFKKP
ncbi:MAG: hypothetical protein NUV91_08850, partial [Candidatus Omnitrophica bacterium]|nr:hypothetical protein [Candidatus Omnitrophota bacterium]